MFHVDQQLGAGTLRHISITGAVNMPLLDIYPALVDQNSAWGDELVPLTRR
jgi:hypothetical protein